MLLSRELEEYIQDLLAKESLSQPAVFRKTAQQESEICTTATDIVPVLRLLKRDNYLQMTMLLDITAIDWLPKGKPQRFEVIYHLLSVTLNVRLRVRLWAAAQARIPSVVSVYASANWAEREVWDMFGIGFEDHPDLRRILTDYDFSGHPLRKDFPMMGRVELLFDKDAGRCRYVPIAPSVDRFRHYDHRQSFRGYLGAAPQVSEEKDPPRG